MKRTYLLLLLTLLGLCQSLQSYADDIPFRQQRREVFGVLPVNDESIVFLGNSITNFGLWAEGFGSDSRVINRGISGNLSGEVFEHIGLIVSGHPAKLFLMIGINDFETPEVVVPNTRRIIETTRRESPSTQIYIQSLLPCNRTERRGMVEPINEELKKLCEQEGVTYVDVYSKLVDNNTTNPGIATAYTNDNLHVTAAGYRLWTSSLEEHIGIKSTWLEGNGVSEPSFNTFENIMLSEFSLLPVNEGDILMIGDYNVQTGEWAELMQSGKVKNRGIGIGWGYSLTLTKLNTAIPHIVKGLPAKIFLQCGARDLGDNTTVEAAYSSYVKAVEAIRQRAPQAEVYLQSIIPFANASLNSTKLVPFNEKVKAYTEADESGKLHFVDVYSALVEDGVLSPKYQGANTTQSRGINGRGYLRWANTLAPYMGEDVSPVAELSNAAFELNDALWEARRIANSAGVGQEPGDYSEAAISTLREAIAAAELVQNNPQSTDEQLSAQAILLKSAIEGINEGIVLPMLSDGDEEYWYKLSTPLRSNLFTQNEGVGTGAMGRAETNLKNQQWKFTERADKAWNIVSRSDGSYLSPEAATDAQLQTTANEPGKGWTLKPADKNGYFIVVCGNAQLHQTNQSLGNKIINWGDGSNTTDDGCQFRISRVTLDPDPDPEPVEVPAALLTLTDISLDGSAPFRIADELAQPVLQAESTTVAIDFTLNHNSNEMVLVGSSNSTTAENFVCVAVAAANNFGVRYDNTTGKYTTTATVGTTRHRIVVTMQPTNPSCTYYMDGAKQRDVAAVVPTFGNVSGVDGLYLGGIVCADNKNKYPMNGTIHSVQFFPGVLTAEQVTSINYNNLTPTSITGAPTDTPSYSIRDGRIVVEGNHAARLYNMEGKLQNNLTAGRPGTYVLQINGTSRKIQINP